MLINKFHPAFLGGSGNGDIALQGYCPGFVVELPTGQSFFYNTDTLQFSPFNINLQVLATGQSPILYTWQTGISSVGPYVDTQSNYTNFYSAQTSLANTDILSFRQIKTDRHLTTLYYKLGSSRGERGRTRN